MFCSNSRLSDLLLLSNDQLARKVVNLSLRANELTNAIQLSKEHVEKIRNDNQKAIRIEKQTSQNRLREQKSHYEAVVSRHQEFIEQVRDLFRPGESIATKFAKLKKKFFVSFISSVVKHDYFDIYSYLKIKHRYARKFQH